MLCVRISISMKTTKINFNLQRKIWLSAISVVQSCLAFVMELEDPSSATQKPVLTNFIVFKTEFCNIHANSLFPSIPKYFTCIFLHDIKIETLLGYKSESLKFRIIMLYVAHCLRYIWYKLRGRYLTPSPSGEWLLLFFSLIS